MTFTDVLIVVGLVTAVAFQVWVTLRVWKSALYERDQKVSQAKLIWCLPVLGAVICFSVLQQEEKAAGHPQRTEQGR
jgi:tellurite resistance protein TehA-like permease